MPSNRVGPYEILKVKEEVKKEEEEAELQRKGGPSA